jgi:hypothetical protein
MESILIIASEGGGAKGLLENPPQKTVSKGV